MQLRKEICAKILKGMSFPCKKTVEIEGYSVKAENTVSYNLNEALVNQMFAELSDTDKNALVFKPNLVLRMYKKLDKNSLLHEAVTVKPSAPTLKLIAED